MIDKEKEPLDKNKSNQALSMKQKLLFMIFCWGVQSWGQAANFKTLGYYQKHLDAKKAMYIGLVIYSISIMLFVLVLLYYNKI
jgi:membrane protease YdiL (CAAX protease family)